MKGWAAAKALRRGVPLVIMAAWLLAALPAGATATRHHHPALHPSIRLLKPKPTLLGDTVVAQVRVRPAVRGVIQVQQRTAGRWQQLHQVQIGRRHMIRIPIRESAPGVATYRVSVRPVGYRPFIGRPLRVRVAGTGVRTKPRKGTVTIAPGQISQLSGSPTGTETIKLAASAHVPVKGDILAIAATKSNPGVLGLVRKVEASGDGTHTVTTTPATLDHAYSSFGAAVSGDLGSVAAALPAKSGSARRPASFPVSCTGSAGETITTTLDLSKMHVQFSLTAAPASIHFLLAGQPSLGLTLKGSASFSCSLDDSVKLTILVPGTPLLVTVQPHIDISVNGAVNVTLTWEPRLAIGFDRGPGLSQNLYALNGSASSISASLAAHADGWFAGELGVSLAGRVGVSGSFGPDVTADASTSGSDICVDVERALKAQLKAFADVFFKHWTFTLASGTFDKATLYKNCLPGGPPPPPPPPPPPGPPSITTASLPPATVGTAYNQTLQASGGSPPYTWSVSAGSLPSGLTLSASGAITGTPATVGSSSVTVRVTDSASKQAERMFGLQVLSGTSMQAMEAPLPPNAGADPRAQLAAVSCPSVGNCSAIGTYWDSAGYQRGLLLTQTAGTWAATEATLPGNALQSNLSPALSSLSCPSAGNCTAIGWYDDTSGFTDGLLIDQTDGVWSAGIEAPVAGLDFQPSVSCPSAGNCVVVGYGDRSALVILVETDGSWTVQTIAPPADADPSNPNVVLSSVSCPALGDCSVVGEYWDGVGNSNDQGVLLNESNGSWEPAVEAFLPADADTAGGSLRLSSVSCASAGNCAAGGSYSDSSRDQLPLTLDEANGVWATGVGASLPPDAAIGGPGSVNAVSCPAVGNCSAFGIYSDGVAYQGMLLTETGGTWAPAVEASLPIPFTNVSFASISCATTGNCSIAGSVLLDEVGGNWAPAIELPLPANAVYTSSYLNSYLNSVSCPAAQECTSVGSYTDTSFAQQGLIVTETP